MTDLVLAVLVPGTVLLAITIDLIALAAWLRAHAVDFTQKKAAAGSRQQRLVSSACTRGTEYGRRILYKKH
jgi:hypothetical protein